MQNIWNEAGDDVINTSDVVTAINSTTGNYGTLSDLCSAGAKFGWGDSNSNDYPFCDDSVTSLTLANANNNTYSATLSTWIGGRPGHPPIKS